MPLFIIFILVPLIELMLLLEVGSVIGSLWTFIIIIATAIIGTRLVKQQGLSTWQTIQQKLSQGEVPARSLFDGICILTSGVLLITPGFMTDIIGFLLLTPAFRILMYKQLGDKIQMRAMAQPQQRGQFHSESFSDAPRQEQESTTLEGEYTRKD